MRALVTRLFCAGYVLVMCNIIMGCGPSYPYRGADGHRYRLVRRAPAAPNGTLYDASLYERQGDQTGRLYILQLGQPQHGGTYISTSP